MSDDEAGDILCSRLGEAIIRRRKALGHSGEYVVAILGVDQAIYNAIEEGTTDRR